MSNQREQESPLEAAASAIGCLLIVLIVLGLMYGLPIAGIFTFVEKAKEYNEELKAERHEIEGSVTAVEVSDVPPPPTLEEENKQREEEGKARINFRYDVGPCYKNKTKITFEDGRFMEFNGITAKPIEIGKYYVITYNGLKEIVEFTTVNSQATMNNEDSFP